MHLVYDSEHKNAPLLRRQPPPAPHILSHDTAGSLNTGADNKRFLHVAKHNATGKIFAKPLTRRSEAKHHLLQILALIYRTHEGMIQHVHADGTKEFAAKDLQLELHRQAIHTTSTAPNSSASNGLTK